MSKSNQRLPNTIPEDDDGYTLTRYLEGRELMHGPLRFTYRPVSSKKKMALKDYIAGKSEEEVLDCLSQATSKQLVDWDAIDHTGAKLGTDWRSVRQIYPAQLERLFMVVLWSVQAGDIDPDKKAGSDGKGWFAPPDEELVPAEQKK